MKTQSKPPAWSAGHSSASTSRVVHRWPRERSAAATCERGEARDLGLGAGPAADHGDAQAHVSSVRLPGTGSPRTAISGTR